MCVCVCVTDVLQYVCSRIKKRIEKIFRVLCVLYYKNYCLEFQEILRLFFIE